MAGARLVRGVVRSELSGPQGAIAERNTPNQTRVLPTL